MTRGSVERWENSGATPAVGRAGRAYAWLLHGFDTAPPAPQLPTPAQRAGLRKKAGWTPQEMADYLSVTRGSVERWESGRRTPAGRVGRAYARLLHAFDTAPPAPQLPTPAQRAGLREQAGWTRQAVAAHLSVTDTTVGNWENDRATPTGRARREYARLLHAFDTAPPVPQLPRGGEAAAGPDDNRQAPTPAGGNAGPQAAGDTPSGGRAGGTGAFPELVVPGGSAGPAAAPSSPHTQHNPAHPASDDTQDDAASATDDSDDSDVEMPEVPAGEGSAVSVVSGGQAAGAEWWAPELPSRAARSHLRQRVGWTQEQVATFLRVTADEVGQWESEGGSEPGTAVAEAYAWLLQGFDTAPAVGLQPAAGQQAPELPSSRAARSHLRQRVGWTQEEVATFLRVTADEVWQWEIEGGSEPRTAVAKAYARLLHAFDTAPPVPQLPTATQRVNLRKKAGWTRQEMAAYLSVTHKTVKSWENGRATPTGRAGRAYAWLLHGFDTAPPVPQLPTAAQRVNLRKKAGWTRQEMAAHLSVRTQVSVLNWENGRATPTGRAGREYARLLHAFANAPAVPPLPSAAERAGLREKAGWTPQEMAAHLSVTKVSVQNWESGRATPAGRVGRAYAWLLHGFDTAPPVPPLPAPAERVNLRKKAGWTPQEMAAHLSVTDKTVGNWESSGATPAVGRAGRAYARLLHAFDTAPPVPQLPRGGEAAAGPDDNRQAPAPAGGNVLTASASPPSNVPVGTGEQPESSDWNAPGEDAAGVVGASGDATDDSDVEMPEVPAGEGSAVYDFGENDPHWLTRALGVRPQEQVVRPQEREGQVGETPHFEPSSPGIPWSDTGLADEDEEEFAVLTGPVGTPGREDPADPGRYVDPALLTRGKDPAESAGFLEEEQEEEESVSRGVPVGHKEQGNAGLGAAGDTPSGGRAGGTGAFPELVVPGGSAGPAAAPSSPHTQHNPAHPASDDTQDDAASATDDSDDSDDSDVEMSDAAGVVGASGDGTDSDVEMPEVPAGEGSAVSVVSGGQAAGAEWWAPELPSRAARSHLRQRVGWTQEQVATFLGVTADEVGQWESEGGSEPGTAVAEAYAWLLQGFDTAPAVGLQPAAGQQAPELPSSRAARSHLRQRVGWTQEEVATFLRVTTGQVWQWEIEGGSEPRTAVAKAYARLLHAFDTAPPVPQLPTPAQRAGLREKAGWTPQEMAAYLSVTHKTVGNWENSGYTPTGRAGREYAWLLHGFDTAPPVPQLPAPAERVNLRKKAGWTQPEMAAHLSVAKVSVEKWESGRRTPAGRAGRAYAWLLHAFDTAPPAPQLPAPAERAGLREQAGWTLQAVAAHLSVRDTAVRDWENGRATPAVGRARREYARLLHAFDTAPAAPPLPRGGEAAAGPDDNRQAPTPAGGNAGPQAAGDTPSGGRAGGTGAFPELVVPGGSAGPAAAPSSPHTQHNPAHPASDDTQDDAASATDDSDDSDDSDVEMSDAAGVVGASGDGTDSDVEMPEVPAGEGSAVSVVSGGQAAGAEWWAPELPSRAARSHLRQRVGWTQEQVATFLGVTADEVGQWESEGGSEPGTAVAEAYAWLLQGFDTAPAVGLQPAAGQQAPELPSSRAARSHLRQRVGWTQEEVATFLRVTTGQVRKWESGRATPVGPGGRAYARLLHAFDTAPPVPQLPTATERAGLREKAGWTPQEMAAHLSVTKVSVQNWESGRATPTGRVGRAYAWLLHGFDTAPAVPQLPAPAERAGLRKKAGWTRQEMAAHLSVTDKTVGNWESSGATPAVGRAGRAYAWLLHGFDTAPPVPQLPRGGEAAAGPDDNRQAPAPAGGNVLTASASPPSNVPVGTGEQPESSDWNAPGEDAAGVVGASGDATDDSDVEMPEVPAGEGSAVYDFGENDPHWLTRALGVRPQEQVVRPQEREGQVGETPHFEPSSPGIPWSDTGLADEDEEEFAVLTGPVGTPGREDPADPGRYVDPALLTRGKDPAESAGFLEEEQEEESVSRGVPVGHKEQGNAGLGAAGDTPSGGRAGGTGAFPELVVPGGSAGPAAAPSSPHTQHNPAHPAHPAHPASDDTQDDAASATDDSDVEMSDAAGVVGASGDGTDSDVEMPEVPAGEGSAVSVVSGGQAAGAEWWAPELPSRAARSHLRQRVGWTQEQVATFLRVTADEVGQWESEGGSEPGTAVAEAYAWLLQGFDTAPAVGLQPAAGQQAPELPSSRAARSHLRQRVGWTQEEVATFLRVTRGQVWQWESEGGSEPGTAVAKAYARLLHAFDTAPPVPQLPAPAQRVNLRKKAGWTQPEMAAHLSVTRVSVQNWESGQATPAVGRVGRAYAWLLHGFDTAPPAPQLPAPAQRAGLREQAGWTLQEMAAHLSVTDTTVRNWENGRATPAGRARREYARLLHAFDTAPPVPQLPRGGEAAAGPDDTRQAPTPAGGNAGPQAAGDTPSGGRAGGTGAFPELVVPGGSAGPAAAPSSPHTQHNPAHPASDDTQDDAASATDDSDVAMSDAAGVVGASGDGTGSDVEMPEVPAGEGSAVSVVSGGQAAGAEWWAPELPSSRAARSHLRQRVGWTQEQVATFLRVTADEVGHWESEGGSEPGTAVAEAYAWLLQGFDTAPAVGLQPAAGQQAPELPSSRAARSHLRQRVGWTQEEVATFLRVTRGQVWQWESEGGSEPGTAVAKAYAWLLHAFANAPAVPPLPTAAERAGLREKAGWTLQEMAAYLSVADKRVGNWENGRATPAVGRVGRAYAWLLHGFDTAPPVPQLPRGGEAAAGPDDNRQAPAPAGGNVLTASASPPSNVPVGTGEQPESSDWNAPGEDAAGVVGASGDATDDSDVEMPEVPAGEGSAVYDFGENDPHWLTRALGVRPQEQVVRPQEREGQVGETPHFEPSSPGIPWSDTGLADEDEEEFAVLTGPVGTPGREDPADPGRYVDPALLTRGKDPAESAGFLEEEQEEESVSRGVPVGHKEQGNAGLGAAGDTPSGGRAGGTGAFPELVVPGGSAGPAAAPSSPHTQHNPAHPAHPAHPASDDTQDDAASATDDSDVEMSDAAGVVGASGDGTDSDVEMPEVPAGEGSAVSVVSGGQAAGAEWWAPELPSRAARSHLRQRVGWTQEQVATFLRVTADEVGQWESEGGSEPGTAVAEAYAWLLQGFDTAPAVGLQPAAGQQAPELPSSRAARSHLRQRVGWTREEVATFLRVTADEVWRWESEGGSEPGTAVAEAYAWLLHAFANAPAVPPLPSAAERAGLREKAGWTPQEMAAYLSVTDKTAKSWESGRATPAGRAGRAYAWLLHGFDTAPPVPQLPAPAQRVNLRKKADWTRQEMAAHLSVTIASVQNWENSGATPAVGRAGRAYARLLHAFDTAPPVPQLPAPAERAGLRKKADWTQSEMAAHLSVTRVSVEKWESGRRTPAGRAGRAYAWLLHAFDTAPPAPQLPAPAERAGLREQAGWTLQAVAAHLSVTDTAVRNWENGRATPAVGRARREYARLLHAFANAPAAPPLPRGGEAAAGPDDNRQAPTPAGGNAGPQAAGDTPSGGRAGGTGAFPELVPGGSAGPAAAPSSPHTQHNPAHPAHPASDDTQDDAASATDDSDDSDVEMPEVPAGEGSAVSVVSGGQAAGAEWWAPELPSSRAARSHLRRRVGWTQEEVATFLGVTADEVGQWESEGGSEPGTAVAEAYAWLLQGFDTAPAVGLQPAAGQQAPELPSSRAARSHLRQRVGWTQEEVATFLRVTRGQVWQWESEGGSEPGTAVAEAYAWLLHAFDTAPPVPQLPAPAQRVNLRKKAGWTLQEMAAYLSVTDKRVGNWENSGATPAVGRVGRAYAWLLHGFDTAPPVPPLPAPAERVNLRKKAGWTRQEMAAYLSVTDKRVGNWESSGATPAGRVGRAYARLLHAFDTAPPVPQLPRGGEAAAGPDDNRQAPADQQPTRTRTGTGTLPAPHTGDRQPKPPSTGRNAPADEDALGGPASFPTPLAEPGGPQPGPAESVVVTGDGSNLALALAQALGQQSVSERPAQVASRGVPWPFDGEDRAAGFAAWLDGRLTEEGAQLINQMGLLDNLSPASSMSFEAAGITLTPGQQVRVALAGGTISADQLGLGQLQRLRLLLSGSGSPGATLARAVLAARAVGVGIVVTGTDGSVRRFAEEEAPVIHLRSDGWHQPSAAPGPRRARSDGRPSEFLQPES
ncbi:transcriptional regulator with XRE-family HTH domain [Streptomyces sp. V4I23]|uniref:helix-turn-helix domain-containing protein n=1 Tax=Streptomyces sp. V4I23 TaxID=3042282 RepID=UPI0027896206|nr:helix-turn-helix domain-containing protein [Streptomyces sp. V4I23]MDQ1005812.1 transcriptional regulator with XRE-family HTH domain [Streptomyces sp. V4I23]